MGNGTHHNETYFNKKGVINLPYKMNLKYAPELCLLERWFFPVKQYFFKTKLKENNFELAILKSIYSLNESQIKAIFIKYLEDLCNILD